MAEWDSTQYLKFNNERTQPSVDLANHIIKEKPLKMIDIGCGPGNSTNVLAQRFPDAYILGVDNSPNMIEAAKKNYPNLHFMLCDASKELGSLERDFDVVFSNACIQWIPNHKVLLSNMLGLLKDNGVLAIQTPMNDEEPIHQIIGEVATSDKWRHHFPNPRIFYNLKQGEYYDLLSDIASDFSMWQTTYFHKMKSHHDIMEWYRGTGLRPYLDVLDEADRVAFEKEIYDKLVIAYPKQRNGDIIFRFPRFFFIAIK
ncbi:methyltransferase domain-containing protein [Microbacter margulisiae]|uniref:Trans-aconitate 2-methyltransferase n=1 Tax=Microbacter margulisiae TaxID=1350067 RepID=A0A7W5DRA3_9PORP|nr:methyltransferase domain-containing protein [Microbacter margulisiae]MBB3187645.1 trans-aconitate 2-methyltransferase [Microbacter margulisiae]